MYSKFDEISQTTVIGYNHALPTLRLFCIHTVRIIIIFSPYTSLCLCRNNNRITLICGLRELREEDETLLPTNKEGVTVIFFFFKVLYIMQSIKPTHKHTLQCYLSKVLVTTNVLNRHPVSEDKTRWKCYDYSICKLLKYDLRVSDCNEPVRFYLFHLYMYVPS